MPHRDNDPSPPSESTAAESAADRGSSGPPPLTVEQERLIHWAASALVAAAVSRRPARLRPADLGEVAGAQVMGAFVSLKRRGRLRGCCGSFGSPVKLYDAVSDAARRTATEDMRLPPVSPSELGHLDLEVWLLYDPKRVAARGEDRLSEVVVGRHGLQVRRGKSGGLLLPGVAVEQDLDAEGFFEAVCQKANLPPTAWKEEDVDLSTFEGRSIEGAFDQAIAQEAGAGRAFLTQPEAVRLAWHCRSNIVALMRGNLTSCFVPERADGTVQAVSLSVRLPGGSYVPPLSKLSLRPGLPLQSTLYELAESAARALTSQGIDAQTLVELEADITVLWDAAMHGTVHEPDFGGFEPAARALMVVEGTRSSWVFNPKQSQEELLSSACAEARVKAPGRATLLSLATVSTNVSARAAYVPRPQKGPSIRPPAVSGSFYPGEAEKLAKMVTGLVGDDESPREAWPAVMVPHAGLMYSGRLAAEVFGRIDIPDVVIVVGPRHRPTGMDWAVAPHETWSLPGVNVPSDPDLAAQLAEKIPDLHLDAIAHQQEHSIEVQLPILARLAPQARVVGLTVGAGDLNRCRDLAQALADSLRDMETRPLLVISTDMNHYASEQENRRLDAIALSALEDLDPAEVYKTAQKHKISMCGLLPTIVVLETLVALDSLRRYERVGYHTSADVTGDKSRVVGYAGMLFG